jgi:hypothetical protein
LASVCTYSRSELRWYDPKHVDDVAAVVTAARRTELPLFVRSGAHHGAAHSSGDGLLVDLRTLDNIDIVVADRTAWMDSGLTAAQVAWALAPHGQQSALSTPAVSVSGGLTLSGGIGFLSRLYGMTIDNVIAAEIVTADGRVHIVDHEQEPELFRALRGGGGNFGIVTRFRCRLVEVREVYGGPLILPATPDTIAKLAEVCVAADDALTVIANVMPAPPTPFIPEAVHGHLIILARACYAGDLQRAEQAVQPLREIATPVLDVMQPMPYAALLDEEAPSKGHPVACGTCSSTTSMNPLAPPLWRVCSVPTLGCERCNSGYWVVRSAALLPMQRRTPTAMPRS